MPTKFENMIMDRYINTVYGPADDFTQMGTEMAGGTEPEGTQPMSLRQFGETIADVPAGLLKGAIQGTIGLPGDIESLTYGVRELINRGANESMLDAFVRGIETKTILPTTENVKQWLDTNVGPLVPEGADQRRVEAAKTAEFVGELGGAGQTIIEGTKAAARGAESLGTSAVRSITGKPDITTEQIYGAMTDTAGTVKAGASNIISPEVAARFLPETKVVDESGKPSIVYHGTGELSDEGEAIQEFQTFSPAWFAKEPSTADIYANVKGGSPTVYSAYLDIKNPLEIKVDMNAPMSGKGGAIRSVLREIGLDEDVDFPGWESSDVWQIVSSSKFMEAAQNAGYDGIKVKEAGVDTFGVFDPNQIRSAISDPQMAGLLDQPAQSAKKATKFGSYEIEPGSENPLKNEVNNSFFRLKDKQGNAVGGVWGDVYNDNLEISYATISDKKMRGQGIYTDFLKEARKSFNVISDIPDNNAAKGAYKKLGAKELRDGRFFLSKIETE